MCLWSRGAFTFLGEPLLNVYVLAKLNNKVIVIRRTVFKSGFIAPGITAAQAAVDDAPAFFGGVVNPCGLENAPTVTCSVTWVYIYVH